MSLQPLPMLTCLFPSVRRWATAGIQVSSHAKNIANLFTAPHLLSFSHLDLNPANACSTCLLLSYVKSFNCSTVPFWTLVLVLLKQLLHTLLCSSSSTSSLIPQRLGFQPYIHVMSELLLHHYLSTASLRFSWGSGRLCTTSFYFFCPTSTPAVALIWLKNISYHSMSKRRFWDACSLALRVLEGSCFKHLRRTQF